MSKHALHIKAVPGGKGIKAANFIRIILTSPIEAPSVVFVIRMP